MHCIRH